jgi:hypothetical protein
VETVALVPTIDAKQAQATLESDRERIFQEITDSIGMDEFNRQLQEFLEGAMRAAAMEALLQRGGLESVGAGESKATIGVLQAELEQVRQVLTKGQEEAKQEVTDRMEVLAKGQEETKREVTARMEVLAKETKREVQETKHELTVFSAVQEETKQQISALEGKIDSILALLQGSDRN